MPRKGRSCPKKGLREGKKLRSLAASDAEQIDHERLEFRAERDYKPFLFSYFYSSSSSSCSCSCSSSHHSPLFYGFSLPFLPFRARSSKRWSEGLARERRKRSFSVTRLLLDRQWRPLF